ncbi:putative membrane protein [Pectobacterium atrosepticum SCRI1043]|uniref:Membrane protein n=1 Tax=Pectobacterium atrosepticum (strain SCRI 1043 / ATCC BAA-672) TaxID=218491 RepID=Q6DA41_PECAS|nr:ABC transporter permease [Pectobacterium atrosepticum]ATY89265.1 ABC transporter permease [Pectobacterium atrosepticum]KFX23857.1 ABC transporter [Pectobacterium atrosepticum]MBL0893254.1 ABC transporter permease [Pectobacterium atrosepticum]MCA6979608.1 ABC transporter permease [Pectobacterium atrosepticum]MCH5020792.1 ABC transporter permease [Pectobacterium atrosepticum]
MLTFADIIRFELRSLLRDPTILLTLFGGILLYSFLYPRPYLAQTPRDLPVVLVDEDKTQLSRRLAFMADATPEVHLVAQRNTLDEAKTLLLHGEAKGIFYIPRHFYRDIMQGKSVTVSYSADASYFLIYGAIAQSLATVGGTAGAQVKISRLLAQGEGIPAASSQWQATPLNAVPVFNSTMGYVDYVVPGVFMLILHQILLMGCGLLGAGQNQRTQSGEVRYWQYATPWRLLLARTLIVGGAYLLSLLYMLGFCLDAYGIAREASMSQLLLFTLPFLLSTLWLGVVLGAAFTRKDLPSQAVLLSSIPIIFLSGFIWPVEMIPAPLNWLAQWVPAVFAIQGILRLNQMGADFTQIAAFWWHLWMLAALYGLLAWGMLGYRQRQYRRENKAARRWLEN